MKILNIAIGIVIGAALVFGAMFLMENRQPPTVTTAELVQQAQEVVRGISVEEYKQMRNDNVEHILLDVREQSEWDAGHLEDDVFIPRGLLEFKVANEIPNKSSNIVVLCKSGGRAALAGQTLQELGYTNVSYIEGGYMEYIEQ